MDEEHDVDEAAHREVCSFCALSYGLSELCEGHEIKEVWESITLVLLHSMSNAAEDDDELFMKAVGMFQRGMGRGALHCLIQRVEAREQHEMH